MIYNDKKSVHGTDLLDELYKCERPEIMRENFLVRDEGFYQLRQS